MKGQMCAMNLAVSLRRVSPDVCRQADGMLDVPEHSSRLGSGLVLSADDCAT